MSATEVLTTVKESIVTSLAAVAVAACGIAVLATSLVIGGLNKHRTGKFRILAEKTLVQPESASGSKK